LPLFNYRISSFYIIVLFVADDVFPFNLLMPGWLNHTLLEWILVKLKYHWLGWFCILIKS